MAIWYKTFRILRLILFWTVQEIYETIVNYFFVLKYNSFVNNTLIIKKINMYGFNFKCTKLNKKSNFFDFIATILV